jgi:hypothetical protein
MTINRTNVNHDLNCWAQHFDAIKAGFKTADVRRTDDRANISAGDTITFLRVDPKTGAPTLVDGEGATVTADSPDARAQKLKVLVTHKNTDAGELALFGVKLSDWNRPGLIVPVAVLSIQVIE